MEAAEAIAGLERSEAALRAYAARYGLSFGSEARDTTPPSGARPRPMVRACPEHAAND